MSYSDYCVLLFVMENSHKEGCPNLNPNAYFLGKLPQSSLYGSAARLYLILNLFNRQIFNAHLFNLVVAKFLLQTVGKCAHQTLTSIQERQKYIRLFQKSEVIIYHIIDKELILD
jgi:hypothetical protein